MFITSLKLNRSMFILSAAIGFVLSVLPEVLIASNTSINRPIEIWLYSQDFFTVVYPFLCTIPFCWELLAERKGGFLRQVVSRISLNKYLTYRYLGGLMLVNLLFFLLSLGSALIAENVIPLTHPSPYSSDLQIELFGDLLVNAPITYALFLSLWRILHISLYFSLGFVLSLFCKNSFIALTGPFIYSIIENYIMSILGIPQYSMTTSFYISRLAPGYAEISDLFAGPAILALFVVTFFLINIMKAHRGSTRCLNIV